MEWGSIRKRRSIANFEEMEAVRQGTQKVAIEENVKNYIQSLLEVDDDYDIYNSVKQQYLIADEGSEFQKLMEAAASYGPDGIKDFLRNMVKESADNPAKDLIDEWEASGDPKYYCEACGEFMGPEWLLGPVCGKCVRRRHQEAVKNVPMDSTLKNKKKAQTAEDYYNREEYSDEIIEAIKAWNANEVYIDNSGNYRIKETKKVAPWNKAVKKEFPNYDDFYEATKRLNSQSSLRKPFDFEKKAQERIPISSLEVSKVIQRKLHRNGIAFMDQIDASLELIRTFLSETQMGQLSKAMESVVNSQEGEDQENVNSQGEDEAPAQEPVEEIVNSQGDGDQDVVNSQEGMIEVPEGMEVAAALDYSPYDKGYKPDDVEVVEKSGRYVIFKVNGKVTFGEIQNNGYYYPLRDFEGWDIEDIKGWMKSISKRHDLKKEALNDEYYAFVGIRNAGSQIRNMGNAGMEYASPYFNEDNYDLTREEIILSAKESAQEVLTLVDELGRMNKGKLAQDHGEAMHPETRKIVNEEDADLYDHYYEIEVGTGTVWSTFWGVYAYDESEALDILGEYLEENMPGLLIDEEYAQELREEGEEIFDEMVYMTGQGQMLPAQELFMHEKPKPGTA